MGPWLHAAANQFVVLDRAAGSVTPWAPPA
jgi:hypothetical protein